MESCENLGFPIAELLEDGSCIITKEQNNTGGEVRPHETTRWYPRRSQILGIGWDGYIPASLRDPRASVLRLRCDGHARRH